MPYERSLRNDRPYGCITTSPIARKKFANVATSRNFNIGLCWPIQRNPTSMSDHSEPSSSSSRSGSGISIVASTTSATVNVTTSIATSPVTPTSAIDTPPIAGPANRPIARPASSRPLYRVRSSSCSTSRGSVAASAGHWNDSPMLAIAAPASTTGSDSSPSSAPANTTSVPTSETSDAPIITRLRGQRSTTPPAIGRASMPGTRFAISSAENADTDWVVR